MVSKKGHFLAFGKIPRNSTNLIDQGSMLNLDFGSWELGNKTMKKSMFILTSLEVTAPYAKSNPMNCSKSHNAETYIVAKWPLTVPPEELLEGEGLEVAESLCKAWGKGGVLEGYDFTYWAWYTPDPKGWARGERWLRCDAMRVIDEKEPRKFKAWKGLVFKGKKLASTRT